MKILRFHESDDATDEANNREYFIKVERDIHRVLYLVSIGVLALIVRACKVPAAITLFNAA